MNNIATTIIPRTQDDFLKYSKPPIHCIPRYTAVISFPQIGLNIHDVNQTNPDLPWTLIYRRCFLSPKPCSNSGFYCIGFYFCRILKNEKIPKFYLMSCKVCNQVSNQFTNCLNYTTLLKFELANKRGGDSRSIFNK